LEMIAELCRQHDVIVVSDEVYEWLIYPPHQHIRIGQRAVSCFSNVFWLRNVAKAAVSLA